MTASPWGLSSAGCNCTKRLASMVLPAFVLPTISRFGMRWVFGCVRRSSSLFSNCLARGYPIQRGRRRWAMRSAAGRSSTPCAAAFRWLALSIEFLNLIKRLDRTGTGQWGLRNPRHPLGPQALDCSTAAASLGRAPGFLRGNDRFGFERPQPVIGVENERFMDGLLTVFLQLAPHFAQLPHAHGWVGRIAIGNLEILLGLGIVEIHRADITRIAPHDELALAFPGCIARIGCVDPGSQHIVIVVNLVDDQAMALQTPPRHPLRQCIIKLTGYSREISSLGSSPVLPYPRPMYYIVWCFASTRGNPCHT